MPFYSTGLTQLDAIRNVKIKITMQNVKII